MSTSIAVIAATQAASHHAHGHAASTSESTAAGAGAREGEGQDVGQTLITDEIITFRSPAVRELPLGWYPPQFEIAYSSLPPLPHLPKCVDNQPFKHKSWLAQHMGEEAFGAKLEQASQKRVEWLGDSILSASCSTFIFDHPTNPESGVCTVSSFTRCN